MEKTWNFPLILHIVAFVFTFQAAQQKKAAVPENADEASLTTAHEERKFPAERPRGSADDEAIRKVVEQFEEAFNRHDAKGVAGLFTMQAEMINAEGHEVRGREEIEQTFDALFESSPDAKVDVEIESIRALGDALVIEEGSSCLTYDDGPREICRYTVIYTKEDDQWRMSYARDSANDESHEEHLMELAWLIGDWIDESSDAVVMSNYRWTENRQAIEGEFVIHAAGYPALDGTHRIGWDPQSRQLRSWVFDSAGGFASGLWSRTDEGWLVKLTGVLRDGRTTSATNRLQQQGCDHLVFQSVDRAIGGTALPDGEELSVVRHGPKPESLSDTRP
ncbi:MAG: SgcJ/EcaC family oxidoreductase [Planctomycetaceae bacterium]